MFDLQSCTLRLRSLDTLSLRACLAFSSLSRSKYRSGFVRNTRLDLNQAVQQIMLDSFVSCQDKEKATFVAIVLTNAS
jgi:hypothetical protein